MFRRSLAVAAVLAAALLPASVVAHADPHPLSLLSVENIVVAPQSGAVIKVEAGVLQSAGQTVTVAWSGVDAASRYDWIGVWSPKPDNYTATSPSKYKWVIPDGTGTGSTELFLVNMRANVVVAYFTNGLQNPVLVAESEPVEFENYELPMHIHLALTNDPTHMRVDWTSKSKSFPSINYGLSADHLNMTTIQVLSSVITADEFCGAPATTVGFHESGFLHTAVLTGLTPNTQYFYQIGAEAADSKSDVLNFWSAPHPDTEDAQFVIFGDLGQVETDGSNEASQMDGSILTTLALAKDIEENIVDRAASTAVFHIGDISYARGYATIWEQFFYQLSGMSPYLPWMTVDGNHERDFPNTGSIWYGTDSGGECGVALAKRFHMPNPPVAAAAADHVQAKNASDPTWWSLDFGPVHFTVISTEHSFDNVTGQQQLAWIEADLKAVNRSKTPFLIFTGHRPMYIDSSWDGGSGSDGYVSRAMIAALEPLLIKYRVDAAFWGHHHSYQRTCTLANNHTCVAASDGVVHIVTGAAGAGFSTNLIQPQPAWIQYATDKVHGYVRATISQRKALKLDFVSAATREVLDSVSIANKFL